MITAMIAIPPTNPPACDIILIRFDDNPYTRLINSVVRILRIEKPYPAIASTKHAPKSPNIQPEAPADKLLLPLF